VSRAGRWRHELSALRAAARKGPTLVLLDEVQAAEAEVVDLLERSHGGGRGRRSRSSRPFASMRSSIPPCARCLHATGTVPTLRRVDLPVWTSAGRAPWRPRRRGGPFPDERVAWLLAASDGSPAVAESLLVAGTWERGGRRASAASPPPVAGARLELISPASLAWLSCPCRLAPRGARGGCRSPVGLCPPPASNAAAEEAVAAGLAYRKAAAGSSTAARLRSSSWRGWTTSAAARCSRAAAERLEAEAADGADASLIAALWTQAGTRSVRSAATVRAAEGRERASDPAGAAACYADALRLLGRDDRAARRSRHRQAEALMRAGRHAAAVRAAGAAVALAADPASKTSALELQALALVQAGRFQLALAAAAAAAAGPRRIGDELGLARARKSAGAGLGRLGREREAIPLLEESRRLFRAHRDARGEADAVHTLAACLARLQDPGAEKSFEEAAVLYRRAEPRMDAGPPMRRTSRPAWAWRYCAPARGATTKPKRSSPRCTRGSGPRPPGPARDRALEMVMNAIDLGKLDRAIALAEQAADLALHLGDHNLIRGQPCGVSDARIRCGRAGRRSRA
jgi:tetratricopeptide (TPR) repeat protein